MDVADGAETRMWAQQQALVGDLKSRGLIRSARVEAAFRGVPRHLFLPNAPIEQVYRDESIPTKLSDGVPISSSSQPAIMAVMLEQLGLEPGHRVLEIGAGTGYNAALMAHMVGEDGAVVALDIDADIVEAAQQHLAAAGLERVLVAHGDGALGHPDAAPYDRIILTVGAWDVATAWREQLAGGGRIVLPLSVGGPQVCLALEEHGGCMRSIATEYCGFMPLRGALASTVSRLNLGSTPGLRLGSEAPVSIDADTLYGWLTRPSRELPTGLRATPSELHAGLWYWLATHAPGFCDLSAQGDAIELGLAPCLVRFSSRPDLCATAGLLGESGLALLAGGRSELGGGTPDDASGLWIRSYGPDRTPAQRLLKEVRAWDAARLPSVKGLSLKLYPLDAPYSPAPDESVLEKQWNRLVIRWP